MISFWIRSSRALSIFDLGMAGQALRKLGAAQLIPEF